MAVKKVSYGGQTLIDLTSDTVASAADIAAGKIGHLNTGEVVTGTHSGGGGGGWSRPTEWGERPAEFTTEKAKAASERTMEALYMLYHNDPNEPNINRFAGFKVDVSSGTYKVERGHMVGTTFTVDETTSGIADNGWYEKELSTVSYEWVLLKITPETSGATIENVTMGSSDGDSARSLSYFKQFVIEVYGRVKAASYRTMRAMFTHRTVCVDVLPNGAFTGSMAYMFQNCYALASLDVSGFNTNGVTNMAGMFIECYALANLDVSGFDTSNVTNMASMFQNCYALTSLDVSGLNTSGVTSMANMFYNCNTLASLDVSGFNTSGVTNMESMFYNCNTLASLDVSGFNTSGVTSMAYMFYNCYALTSLDVSGLNTSGVTSMAYMFQNCYALANLDVSGFDTSNVTNMANMFYNCNTLTSLDVSGFNTSGVTNMANMFTSCSALSSVAGGAFDKSISFSSASRLTHASAVSIINALATIETTQTITFNAWTKNQLTAAEIAVATNKGWDVA